MSLFASTFSVFIRRIKPRDYKDAVKVIKRSITYSWKRLHHPLLIEEFCKKYDLGNFKIKAKKITYFIAEEKISKKILGIVGLKNNQLRTFFVDPDYQRKGIGRQLYNKLESEAKKLKVKKLKVQGGSGLGEQIYKKLGFKKIRTLYKERAGIKYIDAHMEKVLK